MEEERRGVSMSCKYYRGRDFVEGEMEEWGGGGAVRENGEGVNIFRFHILSYSLATANGGFLQREGLLTLPTTGRVTEP